jgi:hypothetical protein
MSYRPLQAFPAITWEGAVLPPAVTKKDKKNKKRAKP